MKRKSNYSKCRHAANALLLMQDDLPLNLNVMRMNHNRTILISSFLDFCRDLHINSQCIRNDGFRVYDGEKDIYSIIYGSNYHRKWTIAHEMGHIYLNHSLDPQVNEETEANLFARQILVPGFTLFKLITEYGIRNQEALASMFGVSKSVINNSLTAMKRMKGVYAESDDKEIWQRQTPSVEEAIRRAEMYYSISV